MNAVQGPPKGVTPKYDLDERRVRIPGLAVGDLVEYDVVNVLRRPLGEGEFSMQHSFQPSGIVDERLEVSVPAGRKVKMKSVPGVKSWETADGTRKVYHWRNQNSEPRQVGPIPYVPGRTPDVQVSSFLSWDDVGRWYSELKDQQTWLPK
jgi:hypothetical protein